MSITRHSRSDPAQPKLNHAFERAPLERISKFKIVALPVKAFVVGHAFESAAIDLTTVATAQRVISRDLVF